MIEKKRTKTGIRKAVFGFFFAIIGMLGLLGNAVMPQEVAYADPVNGDTTSETSNPEGGNSENNNSNNNTANTDDNSNDAKTSTGDGCQKSLGAIGWLVCPTTGKIAEAVDFLYDKIQEILVINPISSEDGSPIYEIWKYCRGLTNIVFIIFLLVVIYSQITGVGISNYGIKKALPKLIIAALLMNLSFLICSVAVDLSNIVGNGLRGLFTSVEESALSGMSAGGEAMTSAHVSSADMFGAMVAGTALVIGATAIAFETGAIWMLIPTILGALVAVVTGLITIALRQAVVALLVMVAPLAVVAYILPNTEGLFNKWRKLLMQMLIFYPMFSLLFGASSLAGLAIIAGAQSGFGVLLGTAVQIFPLFFSWKLMQMSGTFLGDINSKMRGLGMVPVVLGGVWAGARREQSKARRMQYGRTPYSRLQKYLDNRKTLRQMNLESLRTIRKNEASIYARRKISGGYDGSKADGTKGYLKANKYTRNAKDAATSSLLRETVEKDTKHVLGNYGDYFVDRRVRERAKAAKAANDKDTLRYLEKNDVDYRKSAEGARAYLEYSRAQMTAENDDEADFNFMVSEFLAANNNKDKSPEQMEKYKHYIASSAGGLGDEGQGRVLGKILARAASVESSQRRDAHIIAEKYPHMKAAFRSMYVGYAVDDNGYAVDANGNQIEEQRGYLLQHHPEKLVLWDKIDEQGRRYYDWYDGNKYVMRVYDSDKPMMKELLSNFDAPICDPVNNLYGILAGIKPGDITISPEVERELIQGGTSLADIQKMKDGLGRIGLDGYRTTIGRALMSFKEKNAAFSPMVKEMIARGYIENYAQEYLAYLDSLTKATKPGAWNVQDRDAVEMFAMIMDPENWDKVFPTELIKGYRNVNGKPIVGTRYDDDGNKIKVPAEEATRDEMMETVKSKFIEPALKKMPAMTRRMTPSMIENQKPEVVKTWKKLFDAINKCGEELGINPYNKEGDMGEVVKGIRQRYEEADSSGYPGVNHHVVVQEMQINSNGDPDEFARSFVEHCDQYPELARAKRDFNEFVAGNGYSVTVDELYDFAVELLDAYTNLD